MAAAKGKSWVVFKMTIHGKSHTPYAVCEQREWDAMERQRPGYHQLIQDGITNEPAAERLARQGPRGAELGGVLPLAP